ncbi:MAG: hypothetical protein DRR08_07315 [Candidatus Parabeggiatoa sp. nov. 2]|nr:MAG: hypothetical protein B6247_10945 [Beggiatoa sp. 4572_84]RKZ61995.1 MAG: hypothetical protein DRR08_07315 [Gammaproteobacteria bacterium]
MKLKLKIFFVLIFLCFFSGCGHKLDDRIFGCWEHFTEDGLEIRLNLLDNGELFKYTERRKSGGLRDTLLETLSYEYEPVGDNMLEVTATGGVIKTLFCLYLDCTHITEYEIRDKNTLVLSNRGNVVYKRCPSMKTSRTRLRIVSNTTNNTTFINGSHYGKTPVTVKLLPGKYRVQVAKNGFNEYEEIVHLQSSPIVVEAFLDRKTTTGTCNDCPKRITDGINEHIGNDGAWPHLTFYNNIKRDTLRTLQENVMEKNNYRMGDNEIIIMADPIEMGDNALGLSKNTLFTDNLMIPFGDIKMAYLDRSVIILRLHDESTRTIPIDVSSEVLQDIVKAINQGVFLKGKWSDGIWQDGSCHLFSRERIDRWQVKSEKECEQLCRNKSCSAKECCCQFGGFDCYFANKPVIDTSEKFMSPRAMKIKP